MASFAAGYDRRKLIPGMGMAAVALSASMSFQPVAAPPVMDLSGKTAFSTDAVRNVVAGRDQLADQIKAMGETPQSSKPTSILGDALKILNPLDPRSAGASAVAMMAGLSPMGILAAGLIGAGSNLIHPLRQANAAFTPPNPIAPKMKPNLQPTTNYSSWADQVMTPIMAAPTMMLSGFGARKPEPPRIDTLQRQFAAYDRLTRNLGNLDRESGMDATQPGMLPETTISKMGPTFRQGLIKTGQTDLPGIGVERNIALALHAAPSPSLG